MSDSMGEYPARRTDAKARIRWPAWITKIKGRVGRVGKVKSSTWQTWFQGISAFAVPVSIAVLVVGVYQFKSQQNTSAEQTLNQQRQATLDGYLNDISALVLNYKLSSRQSKAAVRALAVARTDTALRNLDGPRKGILVRYLWEADLIRGRSPVVDLHKVNLQGAVFRGAYLYGANLSTNDLIKANFYGADAHGANLSWANLSGAKLNKANLGCFTTSQFDVSVGLLAHEPPRSVDCTTLRRAILTGANLSYANLTGANLTGASLVGAILGGARYNTRQIVLGHIHHKIIAIPKTQWPKGFNPAAKGAVCIDC
jgi:uncharacterized protein YjbI with pentapeptide repeats